MLTVLKHKEDERELQAPDAREVVTPVVLTPTRIVEMLRARGKYQVVKFRSTCSDCVPNL